MDKLPVKMPKAKVLNSKNVLIMAHTQSGSQYQFREYENGKWEMSRDADSRERPDMPNGKWVKLQMLPVIENGQSMIIYLGSGRHIRTSPVTFVGRNN